MVLAYIRFQATNSVTALRTFFSDRTSVALVLAMVLPALFACLIGIPESAPAPGISSVLIGASSFVLGFSYLLSLFDFAKHPIFRLLQWTCLHLSFPKHELIALFWAAMWCMVGGWFLKAGLGF